MEYLGSFSFVINDIEQYETASQFWIVSGKAKYPVLGEVALRIHQVPTSALPRNDRGTYLTTFTPRDF